MTMATEVETLTPPITPKLLGPYSHIARAGLFVSLSAIAGMDPSTGKLIGPDVQSQTKQILKLFSTMLTAAGTDLERVVHVNVFLTMNLTAVLPE